MQSAVATVSPGTVSTAGVRVPCGGLGKVGVCPAVGRLLRGTHVAGAVCVDRDLRASVMVLS